MSHGDAPQLPMLLAEDLFLLLTDDVTGSTAAATYLPLALGGALLAELAIGETAVLDPKAGRGLFASDRIIAVTPLPHDHAGVPAPETDPVLAHALGLLAEKPRSPGDAVAKLGKGTRDVLADRLVTRGILERVDSKVLGLFPRTRWPAADMAHENDVVQRLHACLVTGLTPDPRSAALIGLLGSVDQLHKVIHSDLPRKELKRRAKVIAEGAWATDAVRKAVEATNAAVVAGIMASTVAATS